MRKLFIYITLILLSFGLRAQPTMTLRVAGSDINFGKNLSVGSQVYDYINEDLYIVTCPIESNKTINLATECLKLIGQEAPQTAQSSIKIEQSNHGFSKGEALKFNGSVYTKAKADSKYNAMVVGIVSDSIDANNFELTISGLIPDLGVPGKEYFLSPDNAGKLIVLTDPEQWDIGEVRLSLGWAITEGLVVEIDVGDEIGDIEDYKGEQGEKGEQGDTGKNIELQKSQTHIQWSIAGENNWTDLVALSDLKGAQGDKGNDGATGDKGDTGDTPNITIGTVQSGQTAGATITGITPNLTLNLTLPKGDKGDKGETGDLYSFTSTLSSNLEFHGETITGTAGENLTFGSFVYYDFSSGKWKKASAEDYGTARCKGIATETINNNSSGVILLKGTIRFDSWNWVSTDVWLSTTAGTASNVQPENEGEQIIYLGWALSAKILFFNPSNDIGEL